MESVPGSKSFSIGARRGARTEGGGGATAGWVCALAWLGVLGDEARILDSRSAQGGLEIPLLTPLTSSLLRWSRGAAGGE